MELVNNVALNNLHKAIVVDFARRYADADDQHRVVEFAEGLHFEEGRKYIKVVKKLGHQDIVWGFIMKADDKMFKAGDILMAASVGSTRTEQSTGQHLRGLQHPMGWSQLLVRECHKMLSGCHKLLRLLSPSTII